MKNGAPARHISTSAAAFDQKVDTNTAVQIWRGQQLAEVPFVDFTATGGHQLINDFLSSNSTIMPCTLVLGTWVNIVVFYTGTVSQSLPLRIYKVTA